MLPEHRDRLILDQLPSLRAIALRMWHPSIDLNDLVQEGVVVLLEAVERYDQTRGTSFESFVRLRVRGAMLDCLRHTTPGSRYQKAKARATGIAVVPTRDDVELDTLESPNENPFDSAVHEEAGRLGSKGFAAMPPRERRVAELRCNDLTFRQIAEVLGVCEQRAYQLYQSGIRRAAKALKKAA